MLFERFGLTAVNAFKYLPVKSSQIENGLKLKNGDKINISAF